MSRMNTFPVHREKKDREFPVPSRDVTTKLSLGGNNDVITEFFFFFFGGGGFFIFFPYNIQHCFISHPSDSTVPTDAGIEPRTVATGALAVRRSNHEARSHLITELFLPRGSLVSNIPAGDGKHVNHFLRCRAGDSG
jgi:hypothetical protein